MHTGYKKTGANQAIEEGKVAEGKS